jgi:hypothetical protein
VSSMTPIRRGVRDELQVQPSARTAIHHCGPRRPVPSATAPDRSTPDPIAAPLRGADLVSVGPRGSGAARTAPRRPALSSPVALPVVGTHEVTPFPRAGAPVEIAPAASDRAVSRSACARPWSAEDRPFGSAQRRIVMPTPSSSAGPSREVRLPVPGHESHSCQSGHWTVVSHAGAFTEEFATANTARLEKRAAPASRSRITVPVAPRADRAASLNWPGPIPAEGSGRLGASSRPGGLCVFVVDAASLVILFDLMVPVFAG